MNRLVLRSLAALAVTGAAACAISTQKEVKMGTQSSAQLNAQLPLIQDAEINRYINVLGDSIAHLSDDRNLEWHFYVVDSREVNAFAVPGGFVYVNRGLIERADKMDQLAGVLGHEIGHVTYRHTVKMMEKEQATNIGVTLGCVLTRICNQATGMAINAAGGAVFAKFSREAESEADDAGITHVVRAGIDPRGMPEMFEKLLEERAKRPAGVSAWFATHPLEEDRISATWERIGQLDQTMLRTLTQDTPNFQEFRQRVISLPPVAAPGKKKN
jgi:beta-barrel assembly-enhancing protease